MLLAWNRKMSLTTVIDPVEIIRFHFGESIFALTAGMISGGRLADVGSGAGFPGLPLRMACPSIQLTMIDSNVKKCTFLREVLRKLELEKESGVWNGRIEDWDEEADPSRFDSISARAVGGFEEILQFAKLTLDADGRIVLWIGEEDTEKMIAGNSEDWKWSDPRLIPNSNERFLMFGVRR
jgi:16S rRNA (guanine527-N7)-methyltransferase